MLNAIWVLMIVGAVVCGALTGKLDLVVKASTDSANSAVELAIGLVGVMAFWIGMMKVLQEAGLLRAIARALKPIMTRLFPDIPPEHPAMSMMIMNITSNLLGLGNAATPFGLKAMMELNTLNQVKGVATNSMCLFLAINTSGLSILPTGMIAMRAKIGSDEPGSIVLTTIMATALSTTVAILIAKTLERLPRFAIPTEGIAGIDTAEAERDIEALDTADAEASIAAEAASISGWQKWASWGLIGLVLGSLGYALSLEANTVVNGMSVGWLGAFQTAVKEWLLLLLLVGILLYGVLRGVKVYDAVVEGGKEGFQVALRIIPFLVAILVAVGMLRASGAIDLIVVALQPVTALVGMPAEALPMALLRTLSGSGAYGVSAEIMQTHGADSLIGQIVSTMQGSTETTFYVLALYFGVAQVRNGRHALPACLMADMAGALGAVWACRLLLA